MRGPHLLDIKNYGILFSPIGTDEAAIIKVLGYRSHSQMLEVVKSFKTMFGKVSLDILLFSEAVFK